LLEPVFQQLGAEGELLYRSFSDVLPEQANLELNKITSVRGNFVSLVLGSGSNRWSNIMLAQAYARLGTGRKVDCRVVQNPNAFVELEDFPKLPLSEDVLNEVHLGMSRAVQNLPGSTAARISSSLQEARNRLSAKGLKLYAIGKTGTAMRISATYAKDHRKRECAAFCLYLELRDSADQILSATSTAVYLQDRASAKQGPTNSANAVECTKNFLPHILSWMETQARLRRIAAR
ncbi:MAG: hypothetical protein KDK99_21320, partial [Verrucomicrobiales bacterium]|nr:hypothetical protein [Verrucomicrobiales bacterium]